MTTAGVDRLLGEYRDQTNALSVAFELPRGAQCEYVFTLLILCVTSPAATALP